MSKQYIRLFCMGLAALLLTGCNKHKHDDDDGPGRRTVIVYMSGENNLNSNLWSDLSELTEGSSTLNDKEHLVAFVDDASTGTPYIVELTGGKRDTLLTYNEDFYASDPARFREAIKWIEDKYPAEDDNYALVLWGHATGWIVASDTVASSRRAYGQDNGNNSQYQSRTTRWMNITQMARALEGLPRFRYIMADCCCMMCAEVAYELRHAADYLIGSPAEIPADGAPYNLLVKSLFSEGDEFYRDIIDTYYDYYLEHFNKFSQYGEGSYLIGCSVPLSVADLSKMEELADATRSILKAPEEYNTDSVAYYFHQEAAVMYDMVGLLRRNTAEADYQQWLQVFNRAVPYRRFSAHWMTIYRQLLNNMVYHFNFNADTYGGLSMFIEQPSYSRIGYNDGIRQMEWYRAVGWERF